MKAKVGSLKYAAMKIGCSPPTLYDLIQGGQLRGYHIGTRIVCRSRRLQIVLHFWSGRAPKGVQRAARHREALTAN